MGTSEEDNLCNIMSQDGVIVCRSSSTLDMIIYKCYIVASTGDENGIGHSPDRFFPLL